MKRLLHWIISIFIVLVTLTGILLLIAWTYRDQLANKVLEEINQRVEAKVTFDSYALSPFRYFPDMSLSVRGLTIAGSEIFSGDTLVNIENLYVEVDLWSLVKPPFRVESVQINQANIRAKTGGRSGQLVDLSRGFIQFSRTRAIRESFGF